MEVRGERRGERGEGKMIESDSQVTTTGGDYTSAWNDYRRRRRWYLGVGLGGVAVMAILALFDNKSIEDSIFPVLFPIWMIVSLIAAIRLSRFKCPRCAHPYFATRFRARFLARRCVHCGLQKGAKHGPPEGDP